jgi:two-component system sensor histidine kinase ChiS
MEVGYIAERYNQVMDALQEKSQALESLNASLEAQVQQRTAELETANQELQRLNRLKDDLLANTSHELRTPLNGIIGLAEAMLDDDRGGLSDRERSNLDTIAASGHRLANLVNDLLDFSKLQHQTIDLALRPCTLAVVVEQVLQLHYDQAERKGLALVNAIDLALPPVLADFNRLQQILHNLVSNALKFTQSGEVIVHARRWQPDAELLSQSHPVDPQLGDQQLGQPLDQLTGGVMPSSAIGQGALFDRPGLDPAESEQLDREQSFESPSETADQKWLAISVSDTGIGIPAAAIERIFESFEQADRSTAREYGGTGLGLAIVRQLVELHGGKIWVESRPEVGSIFTLTLPVALEAPALTYEMPSFRRSPMMLRKPATANSKPAPEAPIEPEPITLAPATVEGDRLLEALSQRDTEQLLAKASAARAQPNQRFKILMVDDEPVNLQVLENFLSQEEYEIVTADNGPAALAVLEQGFQPDVVLVDVMMPKMTGYELTQQLRSRYPAHKLPILMLTAKNQVEDLVQGLDSGANDYLTKPVSKKELLARLKTHLQLSHINIAYGRFVPHEFLRLLNKQSILEVELGDQVERQMSVLFSDIRSFTTITENLLPAESFRFINRYLAHMEPAIQQNGGFIDKFIGDAVMALFPESADDAVASAIEMRRNLEVFNRERQQAGEVPIEIGIGINTGQMRLGTVGGKNRMDGTAISDAVNLAARLETLTKRYQSSVLISHHTIAQMEDPTRYHLRFIDRLQVTGKSRPVAVFEAIDGDPSPIRDQKLSTMAHFEEGTWLYHRQEFKSAAVCFEECLRQFPGDRVAQIYLERSVHAALPTTD